MCHAQAQNAEERGSFRDNFADTKVPVGVRRYGILSTNNGRSSQGIEGDVR